MIREIAESGNPFREFPDGTFAYVWPMTFGKFRINYGDDFEIRDCW